MSETLIKVEHTSKKFCRSLKKSLWYGLQDLGREITGRSHGGKSELRPDEFWAVNDVSFELRRGECLGLIGHNGAGKTTLLKMLNGLIKPDNGRIEMRGRVGALLALGAGFNPILSGRENIYVNASVLGLSKRETDERIDEIIDFAEIRDFIDAPVQSYSSGMAVRLGFAIAAKTEPDILLLDEVLAVGDVAFQAKCFNTLAEFRKRGTGFILVSHNMHQIARYADKVLYLSKGEVAYCGDRDIGIGKCLADMQRLEFGNENERTDWSSVYGSGKLAFTGARFHDHNGDEVTEINVSDAVTLMVDYELRETIGDPLLIDVLIRDRDGVVFQGTNEHSGIIFENLNKHGRFEFELGQLPINVDYLDFFVVAMSMSSKEVYDWKRNIRLHIRRIASQHGKLVLPVRWSVS